MARAAEVPEGGVQRGTVIAGRYRVEREIGTGGMATIWEGMHLALNRPIAIKFIDIIGPQSVKIRDRFLREARVAAAVHHRNVVDIVDFGTGDDGRPFMVMELLRGSTLASRLGNGPVPVAEAVSITARLLSGLAAVHDAGIVHRDLKPENVFLVQDADGTYPKLLDFGVSRALDPHSDLESVLPTRENAIVGTPQYMSPEQARGLRNLDHRSDLWSAGVMLYELLTGQLPFDADAVGDVIIQIATEDPPAFAELRPDLAGPVEDVVRTAMQRDPADRFQSARDMRGALLTAATQTAAQLQRSPSQRPSAHPPVAPQDLMAAVGAAYEPGDSGVLDFTQHELALPDFGEAPDSGLREVPPPPPADPFANDQNAATLSGAPAAPKRSFAPMWLGISMGLLIIGVGAAVAGVFILDGDPEPAVADAPEDLDLPSAAPLTVSLGSVPDDAEVWVDGRRVEGPVVELPPDGEPHAIEVRGADGRTWAQDHVATESGAYEVELTEEAAAASDDGPNAGAPSADDTEAGAEPEVGAAPPPRARSGRAGRRRSTRAGRGRATRGGSSDLMRDPGF